MRRVLYIVARERPLLCGYLMATVGARTPDGHPVEIKLDERRSERRRQREARDPERRRGERRHRPTDATDFRSRGYATVVQPGAIPSPDRPPSREPATVWRARSTWWQRAVRARRRVRWWQWGVIALLLTLVGMAIVVGRTRRQPADPARRAVASPTPESGSGQHAGPPAAASTPDTPSLAERSAPRAILAPAHVVTTRASGIVLAVDPRARTLVLHGMGAVAEARTRHVELARDARVVRSERLDRVEDLSHPFTDTVISLSDVRKGDFVVVEMRGPEGTAVARSVVVTFRATDAAGGPARP